MTIVPLTKSAANAFVDSHHSHHSPVLQHRYSIGLRLDSDLVGAVIVESPKAQGLASETVFEVTRLCTIGHRNAASRLLGAATRSARSMGFRRGVSYTRIDERGTCYRAAGWHPVARVKGRDWTSGNKSMRWLPGLYVPSTEVIDRIRWEWGPDAAPARWELVG